MLLLTIINCVSLSVDTGQSRFTDKQNDQENINIGHETSSEEQIDSYEEENEDGTNDSETRDDSDTLNDGEESPSDNTEISGYSYDAITTSYSVPSNSTSGTTTISSVSMPSGTISDVRVLISVEHTCTKDLSAILTSPNGTTVALFDLSGMVVCSSNIEAATFDDESSLFLEQGNSPFSSSYKPIDPLSNFDGENAAGVWNLTIIDSTVGDSGKLIEWTFEFMF